MPPSSSSPCARSSGNLIASLTCPAKYEAGSFDSDVVAEMVQTQEARIAALERLVVASSCSRTSF
jgi:hypothetical protein